MLNYKKYCKPLDKKVRVRIEQREVLFNGQKVHLTKAQFRLFLLIWMHGPIEAEKIMNIKYGDALDGGPVTWLRTLDVLLCFLNRRLRNIGLVIYVPRQGWRELGQI